MHRYRGQRSSQIAGPHDRLGWMGRVRGPPFVQAAQSARPEPVPWRLRQPLADVEALTKHPLRTEVGLRQPRYRQITESAHQVHAGGAGSVVAPHFGGPLSARLGQMKLDGLIAPSLRVNQGVVSTTEGTIEKALVEDNLLTNDRYLKPDIALNDAIPGRISGAALSISSSIH